MSATQISAFPHAVRVIDPAWIPLADGTTLCARIWLPEDAETHPVPAILEYLPYRKDDVTARDDSLRHPYLAGHGYATLRVDIRGSGDSGGVLTDEYSLQEQDDALEVIAWIAEQPWCTGAVGMMGISWSGFNGLQIAARRPPALKAIITACSTDDRYDNDVHYYGGLPLGYYLLPWASVMLAFNARPPDPAIVGDRWRELWHERLDGDVDLIQTWLAHQDRDDYWRGGSVCEDYGAIECAVLAVGGWADAYTDAIFRLLEHLSCPRQAIVGPWGHMFPEIGIPGPAIGFLQESLRWWDHWLKDADTGVMDEPRLRAWMQDPATPEQVDERPGRWVAEDGWPRAAAAAEEVRLALGDRSLDPEDGGTDAGAGPVLQHRSPMTVGLDAGAWCPYGNPGDLPVDQRRDDALSLGFDSAPLTEDLELLGQPVLDLTLSADKPRAFVMARLCDVAPDGASTLITRGALNLSHRAGREHPAVLTPGEAVAVRVPLKAVGYRVPAGHRLRVSLSTSYWPWLWPSPEQATLSVHTGTPSGLRLPRRLPRAEDAALRPFGPPETAVPVPVERVRERRPRLETTHDALTGRVTYTMARDFFGAGRLPSGLEYHDNDPVSFSLIDGDPLSMVVDCRRRISSRREGWSTTVDVHAVMTADADAFHVSSTLDAYEGETRVHAAAFAKTIPRPHA